MTKKEQRKKIVTQANHKGAKHEWLPSTDSVGIPSYINIQVYRYLTQNVFSSVACAILHCSTFLLIPATYILFSLASCSQITRQDLSTNGHPLILITFCSFSLSMFNTLSAQSGLINFTTCKHPHQTGEVFETHIKEQSGVNQYFRA